jgi:hypothetical protein
MKTLKLTQEQYNEVKEKMPHLFKKEGRFKPAKDENYYYSSVFDGVVKTFNDNIDAGRISVGNCYRTRKEAQKELDKQKAIVRVKDYIDEHFGVYEPKPKDDYYIIYWDTDINTVAWDCFYSCKLYSPTGYLESIDKAEQLIKDMRKDLELIYK